MINRGLGGGLGLSLGGGLASSFGTASDPWWMHAPLIDDDAGTVAHVYWRSGALVDSEGNSWTQNGTVPQVASAGKTPPGAGPFSDANNYSLGTGADVLDFAGDWSGYVVFKPTTVTGVKTLACNGGTAAASGFQVYLNATTATLAVWNPGINTVSSGGAVANAVVVACFGIGGGQLRMKLGLGTMGGTAGAMALPSTVPGRIGRSETGQAAASCIIYEAMFTSTAASDAAFTATVNTVMGRL